MCKLLLPLPSLKAGEAVKYKSVFDIIGPVMMGPSSSHTAGAARLGRLARRLFHDKPDEVIITLYESFAQTYRGHCTDLALIGGLLDLDTHDPRIQDAYSLAKQQEIHIILIPSEESADHPNTVRLQLSKKQKEGSRPWDLEFLGISLGGGKIELIELNGFPIHLTGDFPALLIFHEDRFGVIATVTGLLKKSHINIGYMEMSRKGKGSQALMILELDQPLIPAVIGRIRAIPQVHHVWVFQGG
jgi:L-serine dehydratase